MRYSQLNQQIAELKHRGAAAAKRLSALYKQKGATKEDIAAASARVHALQEAVAVMLDIPLQDAGDIIRELTWEGED